jgi:hypothetical protein
VENWIWLRVLQLFLAGSAGDFVAGFLEAASPEAATQLGAMTPTDLDSLLGQHPILRQMQNHPRLKKFLEEFHGYFTEEPTSAAPEGEEA